MNIKRFYAPTSREALAKARMAFGAGTLILSNRNILADQMAFLKAQLPKRSKLST